MALGDRKCVKLQRSVILMTPNDTAPSVHGSFPPPWGTAWIPSTSLISFLPVSFPSLPRRGFLSGLLAAAAAAAPSKPIHGIGIKGTIAN